MPCIVKQIFDFKPESSVYREERGAWKYLKYIPFAPFEGCAEIAAYKSEIKPDRRIP